jgi:hypothetical protein
LAAASHGGRPRPDESAVTGDVTTLEWIRDRIVLGLDKVEVTRIDTLLRELRSNSADEDLKAASQTALALREVIEKLG